MGISPPTEQAILTQKRPSGEPGGASVARKKQANHEAMFTEHVATTRFTKRLGFDQKIKSPATLTAIEANKADEISILLQPTYYSHRQLREH